MSDNDEACNVYYGQQMGTQTGAQRSKSYSAEVRENTLRWAMLNQLRHPPNGFEKVVKAHFYLRRELVRAQHRRRQHADRIRRRRALHLERRGQIHRRRRRPHAAAVVPGRRAAA